MSFPDFFGKCEIISYCICGSGFLPQAATKIGIISESAKKWGKYLEVSYKLRTICIVNRYYYVIHERNISY